MTPNDLKLIAGVLIIASLAVTNYRRIRGKGGTAA
jgi:putative ABC transport system permease protein